MLEVMLHISISTSVIAAMDSTTTTARGTMTGSWRPFTEICLLPPSFVMVDCSLEIEGVGLTDTRKKMSLPSLMPPRIPPEWIGKFDDLSIRIPCILVIVCMTECMGNCRAVTDFESLYGTDR